MNHTQSNSAVFSKMKAQTIIKLISVAILLTSCDKPTQPLISGVILDEHSRPISGAKVSIEGFQFAATTNDKGEYSLQYVPGKFTLAATAVGRLTIKRTMEISQVATIPVTAIELLQYPDVAKWETFLQTEIPKARYGEKWGWGNIFRDGTAQLQSITVLRFDQSGDDIVIGTVEAHWKAGKDIIVPDLVPDLEKVLTSRVRSAGEAWTQQFHVRLGFEHPNTWSWKETLK